MLPVTAPEFNRGAGSDTGLLDLNRGPIVQRWKYRPAASHNKIPQPEVTVLTIYACIKSVSKLFPKLERLSNFQHFKTVDIYLLSLTCHSPAIYNFE